MAGKRLTVVDRFANVFGQAVSLNKAGGHLEEWAKPLALRGGRTPEYNWRRIRFADGSRGSSRIKYGASINKFTTGAVLNGSQEWMKHLQVVKHQMLTHAEYFRIAVGYRAKQAFLTSFKLGRFNSAGSKSWKPLSEYTKMKRVKRGTGTRILVEYGDLLNSIDLKENAKVTQALGMGTVIETKPVPANPSKHKKRTLCYAGFHNNPRRSDTYGSGKYLHNKRRPKKYIQRQFMGHSTVVEQFALQVMDRYLFHDVFLISKR